MNHHLSLTRLVAGLVLVVASGLVSAASCGSEYCINWYSINSGGVMQSQSAGQQWVLSGSIGQWGASQARELASESWQLSGGFWGVVGRVTADVALSELIQTYTGDPLEVSVSTEPKGLAYVITYAGLNEAPTNAGSYAVVVTITEPYFDGAASDTFVIEPAPATLALSDLEQTWDGDPKPVTVTPDPAGVSYSVTYDGANEAPSEVGEYAVLATITDDNYTGADATGTLIISEIDASGPEALLFSVEPARTLVDEPITPAVVVHALDGNGELVEDDDETIVTVELETNPHGATLSGTLSVQVSGGIAVFDDLVIDTIGAGYRLGTSDVLGELEPDVSSAFAVLGIEIFDDRFEVGFQVRD